MNKKAFEKAKATFDYTPREKAIAHLLPIRDEFVQYFDRDKIHSMKVEDYAIGHGTKDWHIFCYSIERTFNDLGCILGATGRKFGIFYSPGDGEYKWAVKFGETKTKAFNKIKKSILALLDDEETGDINSIIDRNALRNSLLKSTEAPCGKTGSFRADGIGAAQLSFPIVGFHIDHLVTDHSEMASDEDGLPRLFLTDYCKAFTRAGDNDFCRHNTHIYNGVKARNGSQSVHHPLISKKTEYRFVKRNTLLCSARELASSHVYKNLPQM